MFNLKKLLLTLVAVSFATSASAETAAEEIARINEEIAVLSAKLAQLEVEAKIATKRQELRKSEGKGGSDEQRPVVRSIEGVNNVMHATLALGNGITQTVAKGGKVNGWTVTQINIDSVVLARGKETVVLGFGHSPAPSANSGPSTPPSNPTSPAGFYR